MKTLPLLAALAALILVGCGEPKNDSALKATIKKTKAEAEARVAVLRERAEVAGATVERDAELEAKAAEIETAYMAAEAIVEATRKETNVPERNNVVSVDSKHGFYSKTVTRSCLGKDEIAQETTVYSVRLPDGTGWMAEVVRENGTVTTAVRKEAAAPASVADPDAAF